LNFFITNLGIIETNGRKKAWREICGTNDMDKVLLFDDDQDLPVMRRGHSSYSQPDSMRLS